MRNESHSLSGSDLLATILPHASGDSGAAQTATQNTASLNASLTTDRQFSELLQLCENIARSRASVLITGSAGRGKKTLARYIHQKSQRAQKNLSVFNCKEVALGEQERVLTLNLSQSLGGTLMINEVGSLSSAAQSRLFQAIQGNADIRFIATSSRNLSVLVKQNEFREDLFYRLNVVNVAVPSLCDRMGDVEFLANAFAQKWSGIHGRENCRFAPEAIQFLNSHRWPGNILELESTIERAVLLSEGNLIRAKDIQIQMGSEVKVLETTSFTTWKPGRTLDEIERNVILEALKHFDSNRTHTAKALGISIRTLRNKLAEYRVLGINA